MKPGKRQQTDGTVEGTQITTQIIDGEGGTIFL